MGVITAGYAQTMIRRLVVRAGAAAAAVTLAIVAGTTVTIMAGLGGTTMENAVPVLLLIYLGCVALIRVRRVHYQRLHTLGLLTIEAAGGDPARVEAGARSRMPGHTDFTVPSTFKPAAKTNPPVPAVSRLLPDVQSSGIRMTAFG